MWTYKALYLGITVPDGEYYMTTDGVNAIIHGGSLVTTVCGTVPIGEYYRTIIPLSTQSYKLALVKSLENKSTR